MTKHALARHESYARNHGGITSAALQEHRWGLALRHGGAALWNVLHLPGFGAGVVREWWSRRRLRTSAH